MSRMNPEMNYFGHMHPLTFKEDYRNDGLLDFCYACKDLLDGPCYTCPSRKCSRHKSYFLHKSCAELPRGHEIHYPMHPKHPLILTASSKKYTCDFCHQNFIPTLSRDLLFYSCSQCNIKLDLKCASLWPNDGHDHKFTLRSRNPTDVACDVCGRGPQEDSCFYFCSICQLIVHKECSYLARHAKIAEHEHQLQLTWWFEDILPKDQEQICEICRTNMDQSRVGYFCQQCCSYIAHNACIAQYVRRYYKTLEEAAKDEPWRNDINHTQLESAAEIKHFSHEHPLTLMAGDHHDRIISCDCCLQLITAKDAFYRCTEEQGQPKTSSCHFYLHITCAQLPLTMIPPGFRFWKLKLYPRANSVDGVFTCFACNSFSQGFLYRRSLSRGIAVDVQCMLLSQKNSLKHESHSHRLRFYKGENHACCGCGNHDRMYWFSCTICKFHLCISCAKLPTTAKHISDSHPLKLTYESAKNELDEYYCDICEGTRDPKHWFYSSTTFDFECHPDCILGTYRQVKLGVDYKIDIHEHLVTLIEKKRSAIPNDKRERILDCKICSKKCVGLVFECATCDINIHHRCAPTTQGRGR